MGSIAGIAFFLGVVAYSVSATLFFVELVRRPERGAPPRVSGIAAMVLLIGTVFHSTHLVVTSFLTNTCPVASMPFALSLGALLTNAAYLTLRVRRGLTPLGVVAAPMALCFLVGAQFVQATTAPEELPTGLLAMHVAANLFGFGLFLLAGAASAFYLFQERRLKNKQRALSGGRLPALDLLDVTEHRLLLAGFPLLTFGVVTGAYFLSALPSVAQGDLWRSAMGMLSWVIVAGVLLARTALGWRGRKTAYGTLAGVVCFLLVLCAYVVRAGGSVPV